MRTKVTLILIFLNVALFFFIFKFEHAWRTEDALKEARRRVLGSETAEIHQLAVTSTIPGGPSYTLVRLREAWALTQPIDWPANEHAVNSILQELRFLTNEASFNVADLPKNEMSLADYGLDKPRVTVTFTSSEGAAIAAGSAAAGPTTVLQIGDASKVGNRLYVLSPDGKRVQVVSRSILDVLSVPLDQLRANTLLTIPVFEAKALTVQTSGARVRIARRDGRWTFDTIVNARASKTQMDLAITQLDTLQVKSFPTTVPATLPSAAPSLRVTIEGNGRSETLLLGDALKTEPTVGGTGTARPSTEYFGQLMNGNALRSPVFTVSVPNDLLDQLRKAQTELRERRVIDDLDGSAVTSITLASPNVPPLTLQRLESTSPDSAWQLARGDAAAAGSQTQPADNAAVKRLLDRLALLTATDFKSDAPSSAQTEAWGFNRPERQITIVMGAAPRGTAGRQVLQLGTDNAGGVYARVRRGDEGGDSVYAVNVDLARDFPVDPNAWRDRTLRQLPTAARISALKLTDLTTQKVVYETKLDANGVAATPPKDPAVLPPLLAGLRTVRAKRFVQDKFADHFMLAGDERTWRYQLDATVVLPGSGGEQTSTNTLYLTDRVGGALQLAGSKEFDAIFELEQPMLDALWSIAYGPRDPGPQLEKK